MSRTYVQLECGCLESLDGFIPDETCNEHNFLVQIPDNEEVMLAEYAKYQAYIN